MKVFTLIDDESKGVVGNVEEKTKRWNDAEDDDEEEKEEEKCLFENIKKIISIAKWIEKKRQNKVHVWKFD